MVSRPGTEGRTTATARRAIAIGARAATTATRISTPAPAIHPAVGRATTRADRDRTATEIRGAVTPAAATADSTAAPTARSSLCPARAAATITATDRAAAALGRAAVRAR